MEQRSLLRISALVSVILLVNVMSSDSAPAFKLKNFQLYKSKEIPPRADRHLIGGSSPIHFINPFGSIAHSANNFQSFFSQQAPMGSSSGSSVYRLPLRLFSNGKPHSVFHGFPAKKQQHVIDYLPQAMSNIIRLPLKYVSNAKPIGIYLKKASYNQV